MNKNFVFILLLCVVTIVAVACSGSGKTHKTKCHECPTFSDNGTVQTLQLV